MPSSVERRGQLRWQIRRCCPARDFAGAPQLAGSLMKSDRRIAALKAVAEYTRHNADFFVTSIPQVLDPETRGRHIKYIKALASQFDDLADALSHGHGSYQEFEQTLNDLHCYAGFWPDRSLISDVLDSFR